MGSEISKKQFCLPAMQYRDNLEKGSVNGFFNSNLLL